MDYIIPLPKSSEIPQSNCLIISVGRAGPVQNP